MKFHSHLSPRGLTAIVGVASVVAALAGARDSFAVDIEAGPIMNNGEASSRCPRVCAARNMTWGGQWTTTVPGRMSVCGCAPRPAAPTPPPPAPTAVPAPNQWYRLQTVFRGTSECLEGN